MNLKTISFAALTGTASLVSAEGAGSLLVPRNPTLTPNGKFAQNPLGHLGGDGPWQAGPNVNNISPDIPDGCVVDQAAYFSRHGSRYPDSHTYEHWVDAAKKFKHDEYEATGPLAFLRDWEPPLSNPDMELGMESKTGAKELFDLGYALRIRYPDLYNEGDPFFVWADNYTRVIQSAELFTHGFLGTNASLGTVVSVSSSGFPSQLGDTLNPAGMCPAFAKESGNQTATWQSTWMPAYKARLSQYIVSGRLNISDNDYASFPAICGYDSQITGRLSSFCDTFNDEELAAFEYEQDIMYYYGLGPAANVSSKVMVPFLDALMKRFVDGPDVEGKNFTGGKFKLPKLLMSFAHDTEVVQLAAATGLFDEQKPLPLDRMDQNRLWRSSHITPMRGYIAFERLSCEAPSSSTAAATATATGSPSKPTSTDGANKELYVRIRINDAVYPLPSCQDGPGKSCSLQEYASYVADKNKALGSFATLCNATAPGTPTGTAKGASFFTDLAQPYLQAVKP